ncbi:glutathione S-transferase U4 [Dichotomopilus funicola]|uniref:Glutathione S-transferase U4 n=1 Tax=Dichotomopilus funicola TaxID=1934379 RepID=A0AAN6ZM02_9PEZI|nr:glutathione S-transferase U4 [Dichotomopilus funicola]
MTPPNTPPVILYHYPYSPYARRVVWYLRLRGISYMQCLQPPTLPRPDLSTHLALAYRRIPLLAIGRDLYLDTRLILRKLEALWPGSPTSQETPPSLPNTGHGQPLGAPPGTDALALQRLLSVLTTSTDLFFRAAALLPAETLPLLRDPKFQRDRRDFFGGGGGSGSSTDGQDARGVVMDDSSSSPSTGKEEDQTKTLEAAATKAEALREIHNTMSFLEDTLLADGRPWILSSPPAHPTLADIEAIWIIHWLLGLPGALYDPTYIHRGRFPRVYVWVDRFQAAVTRAKENVIVRDISGEEAGGFLKGQASYFEPEPTIDETDPLVKVYRLQRGTPIEVWPTDSGVRHRDHGRLVGIGSEEVVWETEAGVRVHAPRHGFRVGLWREASL